MKSISRRFVLAAAVLGLMGLPKAQAGLSYVGSWDLATIDGGYSNSANPFVWTANPQSYSGVEAAAMLFGGNASQYVISTVDANPGNVNHLAFVDGWGDDQYLLSPASETFKLQTGTGYNDPGFSGTAYSAYVVDHAFGDGPVGTFVNFAFRVDDVVSTPEPSTIVSLGCGLVVGIGALLRRRAARRAV